MPCLLKHHTNCFPDLTADICPRDRYDPIDDQRIRKMAKMRPCKPLCVQLGAPARGPSLLPQCPLQCKIQMPSLLAFRTPGLPKPQTYCILARLAPYPSRHSCTTSFQLCSSILASTSTLGSIHSCFLLLQHTSASRRAAKVALEIHRRAGVLSGCPFITDIRMSGTSASPSTAGLCAADSLELRGGDKIKGSTGAPCI